MENEIFDIYLDNNATTACDQRVVEAMLPFFTKRFGNPSSGNELGLDANSAIQLSRVSVSKLINSKPYEIYFTSGATEAINWGIRGIAENAPEHHRHIITTSIEHNAVLETCAFLEKTAGFEVTYIKPDAKGVVNPLHIEQAIKESTLMVVVMHVNNEIGTIQPIEEIGDICKRHEVIFFVDGAQSIGKIECDVKRAKIDLLAASGHKIYAPKGIGFLYVSSTVKNRLNPLIYGGGQEDGLRSGTPNVPYIVGIAEACKILLHSRFEEENSIRLLRDLFKSTICERIPDIVINGCMEQRTAGNFNFSIPGVRSDILLSNIDDVYLSKGSACNTYELHDSHVLCSITSDTDRIRSAIRVSVGRFNTNMEIIRAANRICDEAEKIRLSNSNF